MSAPAAVTGVVSVATADHYTWGESCDGWHLVRDPALSVIEERMPAGTAEQRHRHHRAQQFFYVLGGEAVLEIDGIAHTIAPGQGLYVPPGARHQMRNDTDTPLRFLVISQPMSHGDREND